MKKIILFALVAITLASCSTPKTMGEQYPAMYEEKPMSIAIMPSPYLTMEMYQQESAYDAELFLDKDISMFQKVLGADAAMFTIIKDWRRNNVGGRLYVDVEYILRSTKTGQTLYQREGQISVDTSINGGGGGFGALVGLIATAINTAATDKVVAGRKCNAFVLSDLPAGKYSKMYEADMKSPAGKPLVKATVK